MAKNTQSEHTYYAFISYNAKDTTWGKRLQRKLEHYRMPSTLCSERSSPELRSLAALSADLRK